MRQTRLRAAAEVQATESPEYAALLQENQRLREKLLSATSAGASKSGYLFKYRPQAAGSLWVPLWEPRFLILHEHTLLYHQSERDVGVYPARGEIQLAGTFLELEGLKRRKFHTLNIRDGAGVSLIRLSTESYVDFKAWVDAFEGAGCVKRGGSAVSHSSPTTSAMSDTGDEADSGSHEASRRRSSRSHHRGGGGGGARDSMQSCSPVHMQKQESALSYRELELTKNPGLLTLVMIVLAATNFRLILENSIKYGLRCNPLAFLRAAVTPSGNVLLALCWPALAAFTLNAFAIERFAERCLRAQGTAANADAKRDMPPSKRRRRTSLRTHATEKLVLFLNVVNIVAELALPCFVVYYSAAEPLPAFALTMAATVLWLKLVSYAQVNCALREAHRGGRRRRLCPGERGSGVEPEQAEHLLVYPENLTLGNLLYFLAAPTLCYQLSYPRTPHIHARRVVKRLLQLAAALGVMLFIMEQYIEPTIDNSLRPLQQMDWLRMTERVLKLSVPTLYFWLAMFFAIFHLWLNLLAELTRFADREFYRDWWNATTVGEYWRSWNMPVHKWMLRHVYFPAIRRGVPKFYAGMVVFFVSAVFHELLVAVPLHMWRGWAFWGIMGQIPLMYATEALKQRWSPAPPAPGEEDSDEKQRERLGRQKVVNAAGNAVFWVSFCFLGQPLAEILYFHDWRKLHGPGL